VQVSQISVGNGNTCAIVNGAVVCWGGSSNKLINPTAVPGLTNATSISVGYENTCAVLADGTVWCWGAGSYGVLGNGSSSGYANTPVQVTGITNATAVSVSARFACALLANQSVLCWGDNTQGQLGVGSVGGPYLQSGNSLGGYPTPVPVPNLTNATAVSVSGGDGAVSSSACAIRTTGEVDCWGNTTFDGKTATTTPTQVPTLSGGDLTSISVGAVNACVIRNVLVSRRFQSQVLCWGLDDQNELGDEPSGTPDGTGTSSATPVAALIPSGSLVSSVSVGYGSSCALLVDGTIDCWGGDDGAGYISPVAPLAFSGVTFLSTAAYVTWCTVGNAGVAECYGDNTFGAFGDGVLGGGPAPVVW
jgi:alpha-tubulin suppressor-like RCC1 family protein